MMNDAMMGAKSPHGLGVTPSHALGLRGRWVRWRISSG
jgi:hypothetical protein